MNFEIGFIFIPLIIAGGVIAYWALSTRNKEIDPKTKWFKESQNNSSVSKN
jgi:hypothetical protein